MKFVPCLLACVILFSISPALQAASPYAVVVSEKTQADPAWGKVVQALREKHNATVLTYATNLEQTLSSLRQQFPRYACFVGQPDECTREFVAQVHRLTRRLDDDPYADCFWGILTGYDAANALNIARHRESLTIRNVLSGTDLPLERFEQGAWFCELVAGKNVQKQSGKAPVEQKGPQDTTKALVDGLNSSKVDMFVASGHATERDWMIGFRYKNGFFKHDKGQIYGLDTTGAKHPIQSTNPKVYLPIGNCLMGHIDRPDCMALSWMNSAGVQQMLGYTVPTWFGYMGWGVLDFFVEQPGRYTFTEAFFANHHALTHRLVTYFPEAAQAQANPSARANVQFTLSAQAKANGLTANDARGLAFDREVVAFYGDPAWSARLADGRRSFEQTLTDKDGVFTFDILPRQGAKSFQEVSNNGSQRGGRPFVAFLPRRVSDVKLLSGADLQPVITDDFILVPNPKLCDPQKQYRVTFQARAL